MKKTASPRLQTISVESAAQKGVGPIHPLAQYLLGSQQLFSRAIALSQHPRGTTADNNARVSRLINEAIVEATAAISHYPADPRGYAQRAQIYQAIDKYLPGAPQIALRDWQQAGRLGGNNPDYWRQAAKLCQKIGKNDCVVQNLVRAVAAVPTDGQLLLELARAESRNGELAAAKGHYQQLLSLLVDDRQRRQIKTEIEALDKLLAQAPGLRRQTPSPTQTEMVLKTPKLEAARLRTPVIIAAGEKATAAGKNEAVGNALSGTSVLPGGETELTIHNQKVTPQTRIYLTVMGDSANQPLRLARKGGGFFTVRLAGHALNHDLSFKWLLVSSPAGDGH